MNNKKEIVDKIVYSLIYQTSDWDLGIFRYVNKVTGLQLWIAEGRKAVCLKAPVVTHFNWFQRRTIWKAYKKSIGKQITLLDMYDKRN